MSIETLQEPPKGTIHPDLTKQPAPPPTHNQTLPEHEKIVFFAGKFDEQEEEEEKLRAKRKRLKQQALNQGLTMETLQRARRDLAMEPETVLAREERYIHYMRAFDSPLGTQLSLFPTAIPKRTFSQKELLDKAFTEGRNLGINGKATDTQKYPEHTDLGQEHLRGWHDGQKVNHEFFLSLQESDDAAEAEAARKKEAKLAEQKKKTQEKADAKRDAAAAKLAEKERKEAEKKAAAEEKAAKKKAQAEEKPDKVSRPDFKRRKKH